MSTEEDKYYEVLHYQFKSIMKEIKKADRIVIFRHEVPDYDALGSQMGLYSYIKDWWPEKEVHFVGDITPSFIPRIFPQPEELDEEFYSKPYLAIVVDTGDTKRIAKANLTNATMVIKMDHHPDVDKYGQISCVHPEMAAASELIALMLVSMGGRRRPISKETARNLFIGIVGDSGRFRFPEVSPMTMRIAADLLQTGINKEEIYSQMYFTSAKEFAFKKWALTNYKVSKGGTCYYVLTDKDLHDLGLFIGDGKLQLSLFRDVEGISACVAITEDKEKGNYRLSFRSGTKPVSKVAELYNGGGHLFAAGGKLQSLDDLPGLIKELDNLKEVDNVTSK